MARGTDHRPGTGTPRAASRASCLASGFWGGLAASGSGLWSRAPIYPRIKFACKRFSFGLATGAVCRHDVAPSVGLGGGWAGCKEIADVFLVTQLRSNATRKFFGT